MLISVADIPSSNAAKSIFRRTLFGISTVLKNPIEWRAKCKQQILHTIPQVGCVFYTVQCGHVHLPSGLSAAAMFTSATDYSSGRSVAKPLIITSECQTYGQIGSEMTALCVSECECGGHLCEGVFVCVFVCACMRPMCLC